MEIINLDFDFEKLINSVDKPTAYKIFWTIDLLKKFGRKLQMPYCKKVTANIFELRIRRKIEVRLFYYFHNEQIILFHNFIKKTQKIPKNEIKNLLNKIKRFDLI